ncbi:MAG: aldo/keto reductase [Methanomicrobiales archaeon]|nr:aldo/keto reductase [Methanomicrobiales archaeon]
MLYRTVPKNGDQLSILGFGCMRLPAKGRGIDEERAIRQIRYAIDHGINYFDTAPVYHMGRSEAILARALADGYRGKVKIATKMPHWSVEKREDMDRILGEQLATLQTDHIDYYLLHTINRTAFQRLVGLGVLEFLDAAKKDGRINNAGFSFHATIAEFKEIVDAYPWEFCQIQYNFLDENNQAGTEGLKYAAAKGLAVIIMEPLRGGNLGGKAPESVRKIWESAPTQRSPAEWALRWVWDHPEVTVVLSGMNEESHIDENLRAAQNAQPSSLMLEELAIIHAARDEYKRLMKIGCTGCGYCMPCPFGVDIPGCFAGYNAHHLFPHDNAGRFQYIGRHGGLMGQVSYAGLCRKCGKCAKVCPQHLPIPDLMNQVSREMDGLVIPVVVPILKGGLWCLNKAGAVKRAVLGGK